MFVGNSMTPERNSGKGSTSEGKSSWCWSGEVLGEKGTKYHGLFIVNETKDEITLELSNGCDSFTMVAPIAIISSTKGHSIASFDDGKRVGKVKQIMESISENPASAGSMRVVETVAEDTEDTIELRVASSWGVEFGLTDVHLDIASVPLERKRSNCELLDAAFLRLKQSRTALDAVREQQNQVEIEMEDLEIARTHLHMMQTQAEKDKRLQAFADTLNAFKLLCKERASA